MATDCNVCDVCPYSRSDLIRTNQCPEGDDQCVPKAGGRQRVQERRRLQGGSAPLRLYPDSA